jgi:CheY-like chemotaxis protein
MPKRARRPSTEGETRPSSARRVALVVDDEPVIHTMLRRALEPQGWAVYDAVDGVAALQLLATFEHPLDLLITDMRMPRMGGAELATHVHKMHPNVPILCISGYQDEERPAFCHALAKPFSPDDVLAKVAALTTRIRDGQRGDTGRTGRA